MTGSELMSGDIVDSNSAFIAQALAEIGLAVDEKVTVGDKLDALQQQISRLCRESRLLIINGGLGPTTDDLTAEVLARVNKEQLVVNRDAENHIISWCSMRGIKANNANLKQALLPTSARIFPDAPGSAPAFYLNFDNCLVIATPGVPSELKHITHHHLLSFISQHLDYAPAHSWEKFHLLGIGESRLQQLIHEETSDIEDHIEIGYRAAFPALELKLRPMPGSAPDNPQFAQAKQQILALLQPFIINTTTENFAKRLVNALQQQNKRFSCAESCTGGMIASEITSVPGASAVFPGSIISYSNPIKQQLLKVSAETLNQYGAVSEQTAIAMLQGILAVMSTDYAVAVTGIAGPGGGSPEKPVGTVWVAWGTREKNRAICLHIPLGRALFQRLVTTLALDLIYRELCGEDSIPAYLARWQL